MSEVYLPYAGTSGWSGSDTSEERATLRDKGGTTGRNQTYALLIINSFANYGVTWKELSDRTGWHHGTASGILSVLNTAKQIVRLKEQRNRCAVYVLADYVNGREIAVRRNKSCPNCGHDLRTKGENK